MRKRDIFTICIAWTILVYVGYNVLTAEADAAEKDDKKVCKSYGGEWKDISGDYGHDKGCHFSNDKDRQLYSIRPGDSLDGTGADAELGREDLGMSDEEATVMEDDICYGEDASTTDVKGCMSEKREKQMKDIKKTCDKVDGKWTSEGCVTDSDGPKADRFHEEQDKQLTTEPITKYPDTEITIEDWQNTVTPSTPEEEEEEEKGWTGAQGMRFYDSEEEMEEKEQELEEKAEEATEQEEEAMEEADDNEEESDESESEE